MLPLRFGVASASPRWSSHLWCAPNCCPRPRFRRPRVAAEGSAPPAVSRSILNTTLHIHFAVRSLRSRSGLLPPDSRWGYCRSIRARWGLAGRKVVWFGANMSGVIGAMRRTLLSCALLARDGLIALVPAAFGSLRPANASDLSLTDAVSSYLELNRQEFAVLTTALALLGFSVVAAILLMRTRVRAAGIEARLRAQVGELQVQADRFRALLFAEPQILISWAAGENRPQISGDVALLISPESQPHQPQRILAFGTWLPPEPALQM